MPPSTSYDHPYEYSVPALYGEAFDGQPEEDDLPYPQNTKVL